VDAGRQIDSRWFGSVGPGVVSPDLVTGRRDFECNFGARWHEEIIRRFGAHGQVARTVISAPDAKAGGFDRVTRGGIGDGTADAGGFGADLNQNCAGRAGIGDLNSWDVPIVVDEPAWVGIAVSLLHGKDQVTGGPEPTDDEAAGRVGLNVSNQALMNLVGYLGRHVCACDWLGVFVDDGAADHAGGRAGLGTNSCDSSQGCEGYEEGVSIHKKSPPLCVLDSLIDQLIGNPVQQPFASASSCHVWLLHTQLSDGPPRNGSAARAGTVLEVLSQVLMEPPVYRR